MSGAVYLSAELKPHAETGEALFFHTDPHHTPAQKKFHLKNFLGWLQEGHTIMIKGSAGFTCVYDNLRNIHTSLSKLPFLLLTDKRWNAPFPRG